MFGIDLAPPSTELLIRVEKAYGKPVREELIDNWEPSHLGESSVASDGTPIVRVNTSTGRTEATIVHELFHLKLRAEGFPEVGFEFPPGQNTESNQVFMRWIGFHLRDPIQHWIFYSEIRKMGLNPNAELRAEFKRAVRADNFTGLNPATEQEALTLYFLKAALQLNDPDLVLRITNWYKRKGWNRPLERGRKLRQMITEAKPRTPEEEISVFLRCLNFLLQGTARFELGEWRSEIHGPSFVQRTVTIRVSPP